MLGFFYFLYISGRFYYGLASVVSLMKNSHFPLSITYVSSCMAQYVFTILATDLALVARLFKVSFIDNSVMHFVGTVVVSAHIRPPTVCIANLRVPFPIRRALLFPPSPVFQGIMQILLFYVSKFEC